MTDHSLRAQSLAVLTLTLSLFAPPVVLAQGSSLGTFRWQLQPYCNVLTLTVVQDGAQYHLDGTDDQCGAARKASVVGLAFPNPDGSIGFGLTTVTAPGGTPIHIDAAISLATVGGPWRDSAGNSGTLVLTPGAATAGSVRPVPPGGLPPGSITAAQLAPGAVTAANIAPGAITPQLIAAAFGTCPAGQYLRGVLPNGGVSCEPVLTYNVTTMTENVTDNLGQHPAAAIGSDGHPIFSHWNSTAGTLRFTRCTNRTCTTSNSRTLDASINAGQYTSIAVGTDGLPVISHRDVTQGALRVTHCNDLDCAAVTSTTLLDAPGRLVGKFTSIAIGRDGFPIISYEDATAGGLRVTHCNNVTCTSATSTTVDAPGAVVGLYTSIDIGADGLPIVSHWNAGASALRITHCSNAACTAATSADVDDPTAALVGEYTSIGIGANGLAVASHYNSTTGALRLTHCSNVTCTSATSRDVDSITSDLGRFTSLAIGTDGLPVISHYDGTNFALRVTRCPNAECSNAASTTADDPPTSQLGGDTAIAIGADGLPVIGAFDASFGALRVTKCGNRTCQ